MSPKEERMRIRSTFFSAKAAFREAISQAFDNQGIDIGFGAPIGEQEHSSVARLSFRGDPRSQARNRNGRRGCVKFTHRCVKFTHPPAERVASGACFWLNQAKFAPRIRVASLLL